MSAAAVLPVKQWCRPCKDRGRLALADRVIEGTPMCSSCFRGKPSKGVPIALVSSELERKKQMKRVDEETRSRILKDAAAGMSVEQIRKKHAVSWPTAKNIVSGNGRRPAGGGKKYRRGKISNGGVTLNATPELCDGIWNALPLEKKAALLNRLGE